MYNRDAVAEMKDVLGRLADSMDRLAEVHAKDRSGTGDANKELLEWLKKNGGERKVEETPVSDARADDLKIKRTKEPKPGEEPSINYSTIRDVNAAFRALQGDLGGFQRTLVNAIKWGKDSQTFAEKIRGITPDTMASPIKNYKQAEQWFLEKMGGLRNPDAYKALGDRLAPKGDELFKFLQQGFDPNAAGKVLTQRNKEDLLKEAQAATRVIKQPIPVAAGAASMSQWATMATAAAVAAAPMILAKMAIHTSDNVISEARSRFGNLDPKIATGLATYDLSRLMNNLEMAPKIADSFTKVLKSREELNKTLLPIETAATNVWNHIVTGLAKLANFVLTPVSKTIENWDTSLLNPNNLVGAVRRPMQNMPEMMEKLANNLRNVDIFEDANFVNIGVRMMAKRMARDADKGALDNIVAATPPGALAIQIKRTPIAPPRRFVN